ncbi:MAG: Uma2 family endonuclease [Phormidesmis sp.]
MSIVELISPGTEDEDFGRTVAKPEGPPTKWTVYEQILQVPYYIVFNRYSNQLRIFQLESGRYREQVLQDNRFWIPELDLGLGLWYGIYKAGTHQESERLWLRWYNPDNQWALTSAEVADRRAEAERQRAEAEWQRAEAEWQRAEAEQQRAEAERQRAETERQRASTAEAELEALKERLKNQGIDPDNFL